MKKTFLAMLLAGGTMTMFAQTAPTTPTSPSTPSTPTSPATPSNPATPTEPATTSPNTTQQSAGVEGATGTLNNTQMNTTNTQMNTMNGTNPATPGSTFNMRNGSRMNSTSWTPEKDPTWGWNNYGVWGSDANWNANSNTMNKTTQNGMATTSVTGSVNNQPMSSDANASATDWNNQSATSANGALTSSGAYSAYGTAVPFLPKNVQTHFGEDYPMTSGRTYAWNQYGDWYHTHHMENGRNTQYFYDNRGNGYSLALPVLLTYVPENIVSSALSKYGADLYSISMVKTNDGKENYMIGLLDRGQISTHYLDETGVSINDVWRTEEYGTMQSTQANAAMSDSSSMEMNSNGNMNATDSNMNSGNVEMNKDQKSSSWDAKKDKKKEHGEMKKSNDMR